MSSTGFKIGGIAAVIGLFLFLALAGQLFENVDADEIMVVQHPTSGDLTWYTSPGIQWQGFGKVTIYRKMSDTTLDSKIQFNDKGTGMMKGQFQLELPLSPEHLSALHMRYGSQEAIERSLVKPTIDKVIYMTGPTMSSEESVASKKTELIRYVTDQIERGVYRTTQRVSSVVDPISKESRSVVVAEIVLDKDGKPERQEQSALAEFGIRIVNFAPRDIVYDDVVSEQFKGQQKITMQVQTAMAQTREAEQRKLTAEATGKADVAKAQYEKEVQKIQAVTEARQKLEVATLGAQEAEQYKRQQILEGEGDAAKKRLVMQADGALDRKLEAYVEAQKAWADAMSKYTGNIVPMIQTGQSSGSNGALNFMEIVGAKAAKDLALDLANVKK
jgi:regulator of protease activity HflC (stomatin/prohibitin superfamily)